MSTTLLSAAEKDEIFSHQHDNGPFSALALETACLNYLDRLNRTFRNPLAAPADRRAALKKGMALEEKLFEYIRHETPISYFDSDFREQTKQYIRMREIYVDAVNFTFKRHRFRFVLDLLRLYSEDPCQILPNGISSRQNGNRSCSMITCSSTWARRTRKTSAAKPYPTAITNVTIPWKSKKYGNSR